MIFAFDLDGVIFEMWEGAFDVQKVGEVFPECIETLNWIRDRGHKIVIFTCRTNPALNRYNDGGLAELVLILGQHLSLYGIPYDSIEVFKPFADWYWDDRSNFTHWAKVKREILSLESQHGYSPTNV
jgi:hypothetical protein